MENLVQLIGALGFPIVACICMAVFCVKLILPLHESVKENTAVIREFLEYFKELK